MPEMDGYEATKNIRQLDIEQPYIIAMTANALAEDRDICLSRGMDNYISKPMKMDILVAVLKQALPSKEVSYRLKNKGQYLLLLSWCILIFSFPPDSLFLKFILYFRISMLRL